MHKIPSFRLHLVNSSINNINYYVILILLLLYGFFSFLFFCIYLHISIYLYLSIQSIYLYPSIYLYLTILLPIYISFKTHLSITLFSSGDRIQQSTEQQQSTPDTDQSVTTTGSLVYGLIGRLVGGQIKLLGRLVYRQFGWERQVGRLVYYLKIRLEGLLIYGWLKIDK